MNSIQQNKRVCIAPFYRTEYQVYKWAQIYHRFLKVKIQVQINQNQIIYSYSGEALKSLLLDDQSDDNNQLFYNLEQIRNLDWKGLFGRNNQKTGFWNAYWNQQKLELVGGYLWNGSKIGNWIDLFKNYFCQSQVFEIGEYQENKKKGRWKYTFENIEIGGGSYYSEGEMNNIKIGKWIDLDDEFRSNKQVTYNGEYKFGKKVGRWDIYFRNKQNNAFQLIGGGFYDERGDGFKNGRWIDLDEEFNCNKQVIFIGVYNNGKKIGKWDIWFRQEISQSFTSMQLYFLKCEIINVLVVEDYMKGMMVGLIQMRDFIMKNKLLIMVNIKMVKKLVDGIYFLKKYRKLIFTKCKIFLQSMKPKCLSGGGTYDLGIKRGQWIDLDEWFYIKKYVTWKGKYENGRKCGEWDIRYLDNSPITIIGGGTYGLGIKRGQWNDLEEQFNDKKQAIHKGEYQNGKKVGRWDILYRNNQTGEFTTMQNILYKVCNQNVLVEVVIMMKEVSKLENGLIQMRNLILKNNQLLQVNIKMVKKLVNGINFNIMNNKNIFGSNIQIYHIFRGSVVYDLLGNKIYQKENQKIPEKPVDGIYIVEINNRNQCKLSYIQSKMINLLVVEDYMMKEGMVLSVGYGLICIIQCSVINKFLQLVNIKMVKKLVNGVFLIIINSLKLKCKYNIQSQLQYCISGYGYYAENGNKIGQWNDLDQGFNQDKQITYKGEYRNGHKIGRWDIYYRDTLKDAFIEMQIRLYKAPNQNFQVVVDYMMKETAQKQESGLIWMRDLITINKQLIKAFILMVKKLVDGILNLKEMTVSNLHQCKIIQKFFTQFVLVVVDYTIQRVVAKKLGRGLNWMINLIIKNRKPILVFIIMVKKLVFGIYQFIIKIIIIGSKIQSISLRDSNLYDIFENCKVQQIIVFPKIVYKGKFKNCKKFGRWDIEYRKDNRKPIEQMQRLYKKCLLLHSYQWWWII
ncbi:unnamed protein product [Paramecium primaurelia]|uniref:Uncharacterized protein n=1 Tax=Paramecium primaurelia TaxID=5886 RepID=A0A8S1KL20_PARPR|nr:unnamed protein product [Paramecium primaurelia]